MTAKSGGVTGGIGKKSANANSTIASVRGGGSGRVNIKTGDDE